MKKKFIAIFLSIVLLITPNVFTKADLISENIELKEVEKKIYSKATIDGDFADDSVIVVFKSEESDINRIVTEKDFSDVKCNKIDY